MKQVLFCCFVIILTAFEINCQTRLAGIPDSTIIKGSGERIRLFTDRNIYCVNETIFFTADYSCNSEADSIMWSKVLYVELIKCNGEKLVGLKIKLGQTGASASLRIPGNLFSGNYYLRAYTKWMRNFSVNDYEYRLIKIISPFNNIIEANPYSIKDSAEVQAVLIPSQNAVQGISCSMNKIQYHSREKVEVQFSINDYRSFACSDFFVTASKVGSIDTSFLSLRNQVNESGIKCGDMEYLPEINGITISGKVVEKNLNTPVKSGLISLSETVNGEFFSLYEIKNKGLFIFSLPDLYGKHSFFIQFEATDSGLSEILIDNEFCNRPVSLPYIAFSLNEKEKKLIREMMVNMQLNEKFIISPDTIRKFKTNVIQPVAFYGSGKHIYFTEKYIEMPSIGDFIVEIVRGANVVVNKGKMELELSGISAFSNYPPLILIDNIMVDNDEVFLKTPLDKIERIEVIENGYSIANFKYSGLLSIYSKNKDYSGISLNKNSMFFDFNLLSDENPCAFNKENSSDPRIADLRNLLYWNPDMHISEGEKKTITFNTSDNKGDYVIYISGKNTIDKAPIYGKCFFSVK